MSSFRCENPDPNFGVRGRPESEGKVGVGKGEGSSEDEVGMAGV